MRRRRFLLFPIGASLFLLERAAAAVRGDEVMYVGGTLTDIPDRTEVKLDLESSTEAVFNSKKGSFRFLYANVGSLEYGQKAGRRVGVALVVNPLFLFSKKRRHYLTVGFKDADGQQQGAVLEVGKKHIRGVIDVLESRSGQKVEYESEEAREHVGN